MKGYCSTVQFVHKKGATEYSHRGWFADELGTKIIIRIVAQSKFVPQLHSEASVHVSSNMHPKVACRDIHTRIICVLDSFDDCLCKLGLPGWVGATGVG